MLKIKTIKTDRHRLNLWTCLLKFMHTVNLRAWQSVDISKQNMLQPVCVALQLPIYKVHTIEEKFSVYRGCIEMAILAENIFGYQEPKT